MYELKKMERYLQVNLLGLGPRLMKKNLPGLGLTEVKKHWPRSSDTVLIIFMMGVGFFKYVLFCHIHYVLYCM